MTAMSQSHIMSKNLNIKQQQQKHFKTLSLKDNIESINDKKALENLGAIKCSPSQAERKNLQFNYSKEDLYKNTLSSMTPNDKR